MTQAGTSRRRQGWWLCLLLLLASLCAACCQPQVRHKRPDRASANAARTEAGAVSDKQGSQLSSQLAEYHRGPHHIYDPSSRVVEGCSSQPVPHAWRGELQQPPAASGSQLYGTEAAQALLWAHQHPADCASARFLVQELHAAGIGSQISHMGVGLALALAQGRVYLPDWTPNNFYSRAKPGSGEFCEGEQTMVDCYFQPLSSCTLAHVYGNATAASARTAVFSPAKFKALAAQRAQLTHAAFVGGLLREHWEAIPPQLSAILAAAPIPKAKHLYWWRAQAAAYVVRPNQRTLAEVARRQAAMFPSAHVAAGTVSVHIRRGDKGIEVAPTPDQAYLDRAEEILRAAPGVLRKRIFLSTEDPAALAFFRANATGWQVDAVEVVRNNLRGRPPWIGTTAGSRAGEMLNSLLNLALALECDAWVGTLTSNWCRLIDLLRATARCKAGGLYRDAAQAYPPANLWYR